MLMYAGCARYFLEAPLRRALSDLYSCRIDFRRNAGRITIQPDLFHAALRKLRRLLCGNPPGKRLASGL